MPSLPDLLRSRLAGAARIAVLAVGSPLRGDDAAGLRAAEELQRSLDARPLVDSASPEPLPPGSLPPGSMKRPGPVTSVTRERASQGSAMEWAVYIGETAPEGFTGAIRRFRPTHVVILDAADFGGAPGEAAIIDPAAIRGNPALSTHNLPMSILVKYLASELQCDVLILGVQPVSSRFGESVNPAVADGAKGLARLLLECAGGAA